MTVWCKTPNGHFVFIEEGVIAKIEICAIFARFNNFEMFSDMLVDERRLNLYERCRGQKGIVQQVVVHGTQNLV